jgi:hypothetical protein
MKVGKTRKNMKIGHVIKNKEGENESFIIILKLYRPLYKYHSLR